MNTYQDANAKRPVRILAAVAGCAAALTGLLHGLARRVFWRARPEVLLAGGGRNDGPPDLDELWRDFNRRLSGMFGGKGDGGLQNGSGGSSGGDRGPPDMKSAGIGAGLIAGVVLLIWLGSGFFIVQEGQQGVVLSFGRYSHTVEAGFQWRMPYPFQSHEVVNVTQLRSVEIGRNATVQATGLRDSSMLTQDENIVDIRFTVQYRLKDAQQYLFENQNPDEAVVLAAE
ncbi:MAG: protease modulator HflK, partial [Methylibium sp.]|nr:protease modulator HflK [Methylibium sp.]